MRPCVRYFLVVSLLAAVVCGDRAVTPRAVAGREPARLTLAAKLARSVVTAKFDLARKSAPFEAPLRPTSVVPVDPSPVAVVVPTLLPVPPPAIV